MSTHPLLFYLINRQAPIGADSETT